MVYSKPFCDENMYYDIALCLWITLTLLINNLSSVPGICHDIQQ